MTRSRPFIRVPLLAIALAISALTTTSAEAAATGKRIALVIRSSAAPATVDGDRAVEAHLKSLGFEVTTIDEAASVDAARGADLIIISASVSGNELASAYRQTPTPVITWEPGILPHMGMSGKRENEDYGTEESDRRLWVVNAPHPLAGGLPAGHLNVFAKNVAMGWGKPGLGAAIIATLPGEPDHAAIFGYERGATMDYESIAPARRVFFFLDNGAFPKLSPAGLKLFDAAIRWAIGETGCP